MYYTFLETRNETEDTSFFSVIVGKFCFIFAQSIVSLFNSKVFTQENGFLKYDVLKDHIKNNGGSLFFFNCNQFPDFNCDNFACQGSHKTVLALNQLDKFEKIMKEKKEAFLKSGNLKSRMRLSLQSVFQSYLAANLENIETLRFRETNSHDDYLLEYTKKATELGKRPNTNASCFAYIRDSNGSDYDYFRTNTDFLNIEPCDFLQSVK
ncbi:MAG: hypothetical protein FWD13_06510 [Treponema sp.]|nr:hypothetical protein [Treponema sp.]